MNSTSLQILISLTESKECSISQIAEMLPRKFNNHKDWYDVAFLITGGYAEWSIAKTNWDTTQVHLVAKELFLLHVGNKYRDFGYDVGYEDEPETSQANVFFYPSTKSYLHIQKSREERNANAVNLAIAVTAAFLSAFLTAVFTKLIG